MRPQHPFKILRKFLKGHPELREAATQEGFAKLVGCSKSLVRAVEQGQTKMTPKLARKVQAMTGVSMAWLATKQDPGQPIPGEDGEPITHSGILSRIEAEIARNHEEAAGELLIGSQAILERSESDKEPTRGIKQRMAATMGKLVEEAVMLGLDRGDTALVEEITRLLAKHGGASAAERKAEK